MSTSDGTNFCPLPFAHTTIGTKGTYQICCDHLTPPEHSLNIKDVSFDQWKNSSYVAEIKNSFKQNQQHTGCASCWRNELSTQTSYRKRILKEYAFFKINTDSDQIVNIEIQLGNLCNLSCLMCDETQSSAILAENKRLGINVHNQKDFSWANSAFENLFQMLLDLKPQTINIRGGEPLYNKQLLNLIEKLPEENCSNTLLHITTNATIWNDRWADAIKKFKTVRFMFSIDAIDSLYEYIRFPASWNTVKNNINKIIKINNVNPLVHSVVQNLNVGSLGPLIQWCQEQNLWLNFDQVNGHQYLAIDNLPDNCKQQAKEHLEYCLALPGLAVYLREFLINCQKQLESKLDQTLWEECITYLSLRDQIRNNSHKNFLKY